MEKDQAFVEYVVRAMVKNPSAVRTERRIDQMGVLITLRVNQQDMGSLIGRNGKHIQALRTLLNVVGVLNQARVHLQLVDQNQASNAAGSRIAIPAMGQDESSEEQNLAPAVPLPAPLVTHHGTTHQEKPKPAGRKKGNAAAPKASAPQSSSQVSDDTPISMIGLSSRLVKILERHNMSKIVHLVFHTPQGLIMTPGLTGHDVEAISEALSKLGYILGKYKKLVQA